MEETLRPCPFCGHPRSRLMSRTEYRANGAGLTAFEYEPDVGMGVGGYEREVTMLDFRHIFYRRCNKCGARSRQVKTDWHVRTQEEADDFSLSQDQKSKQWGFDAGSEWARPWREEADAAWNERSGKGAESDG